MTLPPHFEPKARERELYRRWEESGAFRADGASGKPPFVIAMPPPNATGTLHLGHAIGMSIEDAMIRWRRMAGDEALWVPGTDHAAIATESVVIKKLQAEGMADPRGELGREGLLERIREFVEGSRGRIREQIRALGASCDWSRERYTMDPQLNRAVNAVFGRMFRDGLIYRGLRIVNWDPALQTVVSDDEVFHRQQQAKFYTLRYGPFRVGTSRPETKLGDTAVAVHPDDERWKEHVGRTYQVRWPRGHTITVRVVADASVDPETGTGALGVTPAHSHVDFEIAQRHSLPLVQVIGEDGRMTEAAGPYAGMSVKECRKAFVRDLEGEDLIEKIEDYEQPLALCYRSKQPIEPLPKPQWFVDVNRPCVAWKGQVLSLKQVLRDVVESGEVEILPEHETKTYFHWIDNLRDWCISRQIWWGHRIPVWYRGEEDIYVGNRPPKGEGWIQDEQTLDTWFSSALWTWSTLLDPELAADPALPLSELLAGSPDFQRFHPTTVMETGYDILFFWVARMVLSTTYATGQVPFRTVYLHGLVLDAQGEKMSKSKPETCIDPLDTIEEYGADVLRMALMVGIAPGKDVKLGPERIQGCWRLQNKLWNAAKLVLRVAEGPLGSVDAGGALVERRPEHPINRWMTTRLGEVVRNVTGRLEAFTFGVAAEQLQTSFWGEFCDFYLEAIKVEELASLDETARVTLHAFRTYLALFHPYMPFVTEELWSHLGPRSGEGAAGADALLIRAPWPRPDPAHEDAEAAESVDAVVRLVSALRGLRAEQGIEPGSPVRVAVHPKGTGDVLRACEPILARLVRTESLEFSDEPLPAGAGATAVDAAFEASLQLGAADREREKSRLEKQEQKLAGRLASLERNLANEGFLSKAAPEAVERARTEAVELRETLGSIRERLAGL